MITTNASSDRTTRNARSGCSVGWGCLSGIGFLAACLIALVLVMEAKTRPQIETSLSSVQGRCTKQGVEDYLGFLDSIANDTSETEVESQARGYPFRAKARSRSASLRARTTDEFRARRMPVRHKGSAAVSLTRPSSEIQSLSLPRMRIRAQSESPLWESRDSGSLPAGMNTITQPGLSLSRRTQT